MDQGPRTFRDQFLSIYQSMAADVARQSAEITESSGALEGISEKSNSVAAAEVAAGRFAIALQQGGGIENMPDETATLEEMSLPENAKVCAALALRLMWAKLKGDVATVAHIENEELPASKCDAKWAATVKEYVKYFGLNGKGGTIPYIAATDQTPQIITIKSNARIGLIGDWGTGAAPARRVLRQLKQQKPDILVHLGDIYYSGTETECQINFESIVNETLDRKNSDIPVFTLAGNHDMYSGGAGYYGLIKRLNRPPSMQQASFFCLRSADNAWQLLAMDTGQFDFNPITVAHALTKVDATELDWHAERVAEFTGKTILLSHHQLFSAYSPIGKAVPDGRPLAYNAELRKVLDRLQQGGREIAAWFWGHEHNLSIYQPYLNLRRGRCLGHSAIPVFAQDEPYQTVAGVEDPPQVVDAPKLSMADGVYSHGFAMLALGPKAATADYFEDRGGTAVKMYSEVID
jgi:3',5'-cyclic AMP phosphodiesterase CpdA